MSGIRAIANMIGTHEPTYKLDWLDRAEVTLKALGYTVIKMHLSGHATVSGNGGGIRKIPV